MKLSVIVPIYNVERYLAGCLDSVLYPEREDYEIVAVNDGSTDSSPAILADYVRRFPALIRRVDTPNGGLGHARNEGLAAARGDYLLFLDSDDTLAPGALPEMLEALSDEPDILIFDLLSVNEAGRPLGLMPGSAREGLFTLEEYPELLFDPPNACGKLFRAGLFLDTGIRFPDRLWFEDLYTVPKLYPLAGAIRAVRRPWYNYLIRGGSIMRARNTERNLEIIRAVDQVLDHYRRIGLYERYTPQLEFMAFYHELLTSSTRVNLIDARSPVQDELLRDFLGKFPRFEENPYVRSMPAKHKLLLRLILRRRRLTLHALMRLNDRLKGKGT